MTAHPTPDPDGGARAFADVFGDFPGYLGWAPGRVNLIGEHTDYNGGLCLPIALGVGTCAAVGLNTSGVVRVHSEQAGPWLGTVWDLRPGSTTGFAAYVLGSLWAASRVSGVNVNGADVYVDGAVPLGSGLSSSASLICAVVAALAGPRPGDPVSEDLLAATIAAETEGVGAPTGGLDQTVSLFGQEGRALLLDFATGSRTPVPWAPRDHELLVVDTRVTHAHDSGGYGDRRGECRAAAEALGVPSLSDIEDLERVEALYDPVLRRRARHIVTENARVRATAEALTTMAWPEVASTLGPLFVASHASMRDDFEISAPELDLVVDTALEAGAIGARMTGGGFGGSAIVLTPTDRADAVRHAVRAAFAAGGHAEPGFLDGTAGPGARRLTVADAHGISRQGVRRPRPPRCDRRRRGW